MVPASGGAESWGDDDGGTVHEAERLDGPAALLRSGRRCRRFPVAPVTVFYEREPGVVTVLRVYHHAREPLTRA